MADEGHVQLLPGNKRKVSRKAVLLTVAIVCFLVVACVGGFLAWHFLKRESSNKPGHSTPFSLPNGFENSDKNLDDTEVRLQALLKQMTTLDEQDSAATYSVGLVYFTETRSPQSSGSLRPCFFYERVATSGAVSTSEGNYQMLSKEFGVYRDLSNGSILSTWYNELLFNKTEVFPFQRGPWDFNFTKDSAVLKLPYLVQPDKTVSMVSRDINQYDNPIDPNAFRNYNFAAAYHYRSSEFTHLFGNLEKLVDKDMTSYMASGTWFRYSQNLPWMQLGGYPSNLMYAGPEWKIQNLTEIKSDLVQYMRDFNYSHFLSKPTKLEVPNKNSWNYFYDDILERNASGDPIIQYPNPNETSKYNKFQTGYHKILETFMESLKNEVVLLKGQVYSANLSLEYGEYLCELTGYGLIVDVTPKLSTQTPLFDLDLSIGLSWERNQTEAKPNEVIHQSFQRGCFHFGGQGVTHWGVPQWITRLVDDNLMVASSANYLEDTVHPSPLTLSFQVEDIANLNPEEQDQSSKVPHFQGSAVRRDPWPAWLKLPQASGEKANPKTESVDRGPWILTDLEFIRLKGGLSDVPADIRSDLETPFNSWEKC